MQNQNFVHFLKRGKGILVQSFKATGQETTSVDPFICESVTKIPYPITHSLTEVYHVTGTYFPMRVSYKTNFLKNHFKVNVNFTRMFSFVV